MYRATGFEGGDRTSDTKTLNQTFNIKLSLAAEPLENWVTLQPYNLCRRQELRLIKCVANLDQLSPLATAKRHARKAGGYACGW